MRRLRREGGARFHVVWRRDGRNVVETGSHGTAATDSNRCRAILRFGIPNCRSRLTPVSRFRASQRPFRPRADLRCLARRLFAATSNRTLVAAQRSSWPPTAHAAIERVLPTLSRPSRNMKPVVQSTSPRVGTAVDKPPRGSLRPCCRRQSRAASASRRVNGPCRSW